MLSIYSKLLHFNIREYIFLLKLNELRLSDNKNLNLKKKSTYWENNYLKLNFFKLK